MAFRIDDEETIQMIQQLSEMTGKDHETVVLVSVQKALERARAEVPVNPLPPEKQD
jgi:hypothetical protein